MSMEVPGSQTCSTWKLAEREHILVRRLLRSAADMSGKLSPRQQAVMEGALNLALRLGLPAEKLLEQLLHEEGGAELYQAYHRAVSLSLTHYCTPFISMAKRCLCLALPHTL